MKMKINNLNISKIIILFIICFQLTHNMKVRITGYKTFENKNREHDFYKESMNNNNEYESPDLHHSAGDWNSQDDAEMSNLEIRNQIYSHNTEPIMRVYADSVPSNSESTSSTSNENYTNQNNQESPKYISRMISGPPHSYPQPIVHHPQFTVTSCPCAAMVKCQPCGLIPDLDFLNTNSRIACPCAPKLNCPACPPLSLIHEIAAKKVNYIFK